MIEKILDLSVRHRWFIVLLTAVACGLGVWSLNRLPIDAVPDVTNNQVQINAIAPALTPVEMEKQITFQIENILAGTPTLEYTRSFSRNGFAQVTAVFRDNTSIYFARQQVNERLQEIPQSLPPEAEVKLGPISTGRARRRAHRGYRRDWRDRRRHPWRHAAAGEGSGRGVDRA
jgi:heavy metal efflux system protein